MSIVHKKSFLGLIIAYSGIAFGAFIVIILLPNFFTPEEFGLRSFIFDLSLVFAQLFMAGLSGSIIKFYPRLKSSPSLKSELILKSLSIVIILFTITYSLFLIFEEQVLELFNEQSPLASTYFTYGIFIGLVLAIFQILETYCRNIYSFNYSRILKDVIFRFLSISLIILFGLKYIKLSVFWNLTVISYLIIITLLILHIIKKDHFKIQLNSIWRVPKKIKEISTYSTFSLLSSSSSMLLSKIDAIMITALIGLESTAVYSMVIFISILIETPKKILSQVVSPLISTAINESNQHQLEQIYKKTSETLTLISTFSLALIWVNLDTLFSLIPNGELFSTGKISFLLLGMAKVTDMLFSCNNEILSYSKEYKQNFIATTTLIFFTILSNYLLIPTYGITGAAGATLVSVILFNIYKAYIIKVRLNLSFFKRNTLINFVLVGLIYLIWESLTNINNLYLKSFIGSSSIIFLYLFGIFKLNLSEEVKRFIEEFLRRLRK